MAALVLSFGIALPVSALDAYGNVDSATEGSVNVGTGNTNADVGVDVTVGSQTSGSGTSGSGSVEGSTNVDTSVQTSGNINVAGDTVVITRADIKADTVTTSSVAPASVKTNADLSGYVAAQMKADENISAVESASDSVAVTYKQKAKLFGFIPVKVNATATVDAAGNVTVRYPWYAFLMATNKADLEARLQDRVDAVFAANVAMNTDASASANAAADVAADVNATAEASGELTAAQQALIVQEIRGAMQAELEAAVDASADARVNKIDGMTVKQ